jgi:hypothetical protein
LRPWPPATCLFGQKIHFPAVKITGNGPFWPFRIGVLIFFLIPLMPVDGAPFWAAPGYPVKFFDGNKY